MMLRSAIAGIFLLLAATHARAEPIFELSWFGQPRSAALVGRPDLNWIEEPEPFGIGQLVALHAANFDIIDGKPFSARIVEAYGTIVSARLEHTLNVANAAECESAGGRLLAEIERRLGSLYWSLALSEGQHAVRTGESSIMIVQGWRRSPRIMPVPREQYADSRTTDFAIRARALPRDARGEYPTLVSADLEDGRCRFRIEINLP